jgi:hypothetical protein
MAAMASATRSLPYRVDSEYDVINILKHRHEIPYHSRPFMWTREAHIEYVVHETIRAWRSGELYWLGIVILFTGDKYPAISDAQHRLTLCFLMILSLAQSLPYPDALKWISTYGDDDMVLTPHIPDDDRMLLDKYGWSRLPNIKSCYEQDFETLGDLLNNKEPDISDGKNKLYDAFQTVKDLIEREIPDVGDKRSFLRFLHNDVKILRIAITDWNFTIRVFNSFNNIKVPVPPSYLLKNAFAEKIGAERSAEIHEVFCSIKREHDGKEDIEQFVHTVTNMWRRSLLPFKEYERTVGSLVRESTTDALMEFQELAIKTDIVTKIVEEDSYGKILRALSRGNEIMNICLRPLGIVAYSAGNITPLLMVVRMLVSFAIRQQNRVGFNPLKYQDAIRPMMNNLLSGKMTVDKTITELREKLVEWLKGTPGENNKMLIESLIAENYSSTKFMRARAMLLYLVLKTDCHETTLNQEATQIDHVYPKTPSAKHASLHDKELRHSIGNFTPLVGSNSTDGMKGNTSLGNKPFSEKAPYYAMSNIKITRDIAGTYGTAGVFLDSQIKERSRILASQIAYCTGIELGIS